MLQDRYEDLNSFSKWKHVGRTIFLPRNKREEIFWKDKGIYHYLAYIVILD